MTPRTSYPKRAPAPAKSSGFTRAAAYARAMNAARERLARTDWPDTHAIWATVVALLPYQFARLEKAFPEPHLILNEAQLRRALELAFGQSLAL